MNKSKKMIAFQTFIDSQISLLKSNCEPVDKVDVSTIVDTDLLCPIIKNDIEQI